MTHPTLTGLKDQAKRLRGALADQGTPISHSQALELVAHQHGARDWNTLRAQAVAHPALPQVGDTVTARYLGHSVRGVLKSLEKLSRGEAWRVTLHLDQPVDVVRFDSFSAMRQRISGTIGPDGRSFSHTSDGTPHLVLDLAAA